MLGEEKIFAEWQGGGGDPGGFPLYFGEKKKLLRDIETCRICNFMLIIFRSRRAGAANFMLINFQELC